MPLLLLLALAATPTPKGKLGPPPAASARARPPWCTGTYADDFQALSKASTELNSRPEGHFTACVRTTAVYECLSYAPDGSVRRTKQTAIAHGTAFAFKKKDGETYLLTNHHVSEWPAVTDDDHAVAGVAPGCKRVSDALRIVDSEKDAYEGDDVALTRVVNDPALDVAVVKTRATIPVMPWRIGRSAALRDRNVVEVRGYPLGAFKATVEGRVTNTYDHDDFKDWDHDDFVVDAQLSGGNSGSPVLAVSCATGEYELVGVFHADYARGHSLNVVVHIDQVRELMTTLKRSALPRADQLPLDMQARRHLAEDAAELGHVFVPFGALAAEVRPRADGALLFSLFGKEFPTASWPVLVVEDLDDSASGAFGHPGRVWFGNARGLKELSPFEADEPGLATIERTLDVMRRLALAATTWRRATVRAATSREATLELDRADKDLRRLSTAGRDLSATVLELAEKHGPGAKDTPTPPSRPFLGAAEPEPLTRDVPLENAP